MNEVKQPQRWKDLGVKDKAALETACVSFALGFILLFAGLFLGDEGEISAGVLTGFGTALLYTASIFGVAMYVKSSNSEIYNNVMNGVSKLLEQHNKEQENKQ